MVVIAKRSNVIPVDFGEFTLEYRANDENIKRMKEIGENLTARGEALKETDGEDVLQELYEAVKASWIELFDEEAFNKVYAFSDNTTTETVLYLFETIEGIVAEFEQLNATDSLKKYLAD
ncbi:hypothetical protein ACTGYT_09665 [Streptococcus suis]